MLDDTTRLYAALIEEDATDLYENAPCGYFSATDDGMLLRTNATFLAMTGYTRERLDHTRLLDILTVGSRILFETHLRPLLRMQGFLREIAVDFVCADGRQIPVLLNATERRATGTPVTVMRAMVVDATERRLYERELLLARRKAEEAARARSDLIAMVSHDVRAPLGAAVTAAAMLQTSEPSPKQQRYIDVVKSSVAQAVTLLNSILDLSALEGGRPVLSEKPFEIRQLVEQVTANAAPATAQKPQLTVQVRIDEAVPQHLVGDRHKLAQVLTNLMTNAVKFTEKGTVALAVYARDVSAESVTLDCVVSDTGIGIAADRLPHIFEEFTQASEDIAETYGGSGLGLAITQKLLRLYRSELHVTSTLGQGTTFSFTLQLKRAE